MIQKKELDSAGLLVNGEKISLASHAGRQMAGFGD